MLFRSLLVPGLLKPRTLPSGRLHRPLKRNCTYGLLAVKRYCTHFFATLHPQVHSMAHLEALPPAPVLQRDLFNESLQLKALRIPKRECQKYMKLLEGYTFERPRLRCILPDATGEDTRLLLLAETVHERELDQIREKLADDDVPIISYELPLHYTYFPADYILKRLLPEGCEVPTSFESVGHIAHVNLRDELLPYKHVIGQVLLDKNSSIRTVVNKVGTIENEYRVFKMEVLAGDPDLETEVKQYKARFRLNYGDVYWNSRLEQEHRRLTDSFRKDEVIVDMMAGIGPFAVPAAQRGSQVYANDLNPRSHHYLDINVKLNKVQERVRTCCMDARAFMQLLCQSRASGSACSGSDQVRRWKVPEGGLLFNHVIMNLPASAVEFLDVFKGCLKEHQWQEQPLPTIHCYTFAKADESNADIQRRAEGYLGGPVGDDVKIHLVRDVAPNKRMFCISFMLPPAIAFHRHQDAADEPATKRTKTAL